MIKKIKNDFIWKYKMTKITTKYFLGKISYEEWSSKLSKILEDKIYKEIEQEFRKKVK